MLASRVRAIYNIHCCANVNAGCDLNHVSGEWEDWPAGWQFWLDHCLCGNLLMMCINVRGVCEHIFICQKSDRLAKTLRASKNSPTTFSCRFSTFLFYLFICAFSLHRFVLFWFCVSFEMWQCAKNEISIQMHENTLNFHLILSPVICHKTHNILNCIDS